MRRHHAGISAAGALLDYLKATLKETPGFTKITAFRQTANMFLDAATQRNLELTHSMKDGAREGTLLWALDETLTPMGGRLLRNALLRPLTDSAQIRVRHNALDRLIEDFELLETLRPKEIPAKEVKETPTSDAHGVVERVPLRGLRRTIAQAMVKSKSTIPHAAGIDEADISQLVALKSRAKERAAQKKIHLTFLPFVMKALVAALQEHPYLNASLDDEKGEIILKKYYNIGVAVDTKDGLMVPVVKNVRAKNILQLAAELEALSDKARNRTIDLADLKGGTFTITNFGAMGGIFGWQHTVDQIDSALQSML